MILVNDRYNRSRERRSWAGSFAQTRCVLKFGVYLMENLMPEISRHQRLNGPLT